MTIYGVDIHPEYQRGISIEQVRAEGFDFMACKVSEGTTVYDSQEWLRRGKAAGLLCLGYHYLHPGDESGQARVFVEQLTRAGVPGMLDAEALASDGRTPTLTVDGVRRFLGYCQTAGVNVPLLYLPRWYWTRLGSPDLTGLTLWASSYPSADTGTASQLYTAVTPNRWAAYGGRDVAVLQFTDRARVAGRSVDANAFLGTRDQFAALIGGDDMPSPAEIWGHMLPDPYVGPNGEKAQPKTAGDLLGWAATHAAVAKERATAARAEIAALRAAVDSLSVGLDERIKAALAGVVDVQVTVRDKTTGGS